MTKKSAAVQPSADSHIMRAEHVQQVSQILFLKSYLESQVNSLDAEIANLLRIAYGVDISQGDWHLDTDKGVLSRASQPSNQP